MCFFFVCGEQTFRRDVKGYEGLVCRCQHCGNMAGHVINSKPFFTFCFIPIIPFTISGYDEVVCQICKFQQPLNQRPDVTAMANGGQRGDGGGGAYPPQQHQGAPQQGYSQQGKPNYSQPPYNQPQYGGQAPPAYG